MDWTNLFSKKAEAPKDIGNAFQITANSFESCRVTIYLHEKTQEAISKILEVNQSLSIKKILDHAAHAIHDDVQKFLPTPKVKEVDYQAEDASQLIKNLNQHAKKICFFNTFSQQLSAFALEKKTRKTFVMSKRSEILYSTLASLLQKDLDIIINCIFISYDQHLIGRRMDILKAYAVFMENYRNLFYRLEFMIDQDFIDHVASFSCPKVAEILADIFDKYQQVEKICLDAARKSVKENKEDILQLGDVDEIVISYDNKTTINVFDFVELCSSSAPEDEPDEEWDWFYKGGE